MTMETTEIPFLPCGYFAEDSSKDILSWFEDNTSLAIGYVDTVVTAYMDGMDDEDAEAFLIFFNRDGDLCSFTVCGDADMKRPWGHGGNVEQIDTNGAQCLFDCADNVGDFDEKRFATIVEALRNRDRDIINQANQLALF